MLYWQNLFEGQSLNGLFSVKSVKNYPKYMVLVLSKLFGVLPGFYLTVLVGYLAINIFLCEPWSDGAEWNGVFK